MARSYIKEEERTVVNEKLGVLTNEIQEELIRISTLSRFKVCSDIESIRQRSLLEKAPDAEFAIRLFRKYSTSIRSLKPAEKGNERFGSQLQSYLSEGAAVQMSGSGAFRHHVFWLRVGIWIFSFLSYVIMATVPNITLPLVHPHNAFTAGCMSRVVSGYFDYRPYQLIIAASVLAFIYSSFILVYYILPVDADSKKVLPGYANPLNICLYLRIHPAVKNCLESCCSMCQISPALVEMVTDIVLVVFTVAACLIASIVLERGARFDLGMGDLTYYTIGTFFSTYSHTYPICVDEDPGPKIRASMSMCYLALFLLALCCQASIRTFYFAQTNNPQPIESRKDLQKDGRSLLSRSELDNGEAEADDIEEVTL